MKLSRRHVLKAAGVSLALPTLEATAPARPDPKAAPRRMVLVCTPLGIHPPNFFPEKSGKDYAPSPYLETLKEYRNDFTVFSGLAHVGVDSGHDSMFSYLTAAPHPERRAGFKNSISLDQLAAEQIGDQTRFPSLALAGEGFSLSWTRSGALVPSESWPASTFAKLFIDGKKDDVDAQVRRLRDGQSVLDTVGDQAKKVAGTVGQADREKLDEYFSSVRELEKRLSKAEEWSKKPKPKVDVQQPQNITNPADVLGRTRLLFDLTHLALQTDSTRFVTILLGGASLVPPIPGVSFDHHNLSHHGQDPEKLKQLAIVESETFKLLAGLLGKLKGSKEHGATVLDRTMVMYGSNMSSGNSHSCKNLPILLAGGGFKHGQHLAFDKGKEPPLANLFVSMLQRLGLEIDKFGTSAGTLPGLERAG
ncbi:MAG: DUF1552 domain-containing protein [Gemmata sp.]